MSDWIKICGVRDLATAELCAQQAVSAIGLNFFAKSPRSVSMVGAAAIANFAASHNVTPIGLFVNHSAEEIESIAKQVKLITLQLHGDETPALIRSLHERHPDWKFLKAFRVGDSLQPVADFLAEAKRLNVRLAGCLLDAKVDGAFGGTGRVAPWDVIAREYDRTNWPPLILAGGLTPDNVAEAIQTVRPWGVDTASGVESSAGVKDSKLLARFVAEARRGFAGANSSVPFVSSVP